ncbi:Fe-S protein assembly co-chaperone HscB [Polynucleobacter sp. IMCC30063]|uniref:Fe-S protein assembly co-chaperone HscB n=1 Tax=Polynucleobacter sp. IMCC30063 TaxID=2907298 RepID=UPI001F437969|nr:Fe-S protein assembly co-chaperone HscB [Polynucleobacter sp. IMCC30063]
MANLSASEDYFQFFGLNPQFQVNVAELDRAYLAVQKEVHPDRHARGTESEQRLAMQLATLANTAYQTLKNPIQRGLYLCELHGVNAQLETNTAMPAAFLLQQIAWRENLEEHEDNLAALAILSQEVRLSYQDTIAELTEAIDRAGNFVRAAELLRGLLFIDKFATELDDATADLA